MKYAIKYPSIKRVEILGGIHEDFYNARHLTDPTELDERWKIAEMMLRHFKFYDFKMQEIRTSNKIEKLPDDLDSILPPDDKEKLINF
jgi:hypothetical protein